MYMSKYLKIGLALSGIILFGAGCAQSSENSKSSKNSENSTTSEVTMPVVATTPTPEAVIEYKNGMFNPATLRVLVGTKVTFVNKGTKEVWPASGRHPTHEICPGFDALKGLKNGETYPHVFDKPAECPFHNHLAPAEHGSIEVKPAE